MALMSGGEILVQILKANKIKYIFGTSGTTFTEVLDCIVGTDIRLIHTLHESCAIAMADGYSKATSRPSFVIVHDIAGTSNVIGGLSNACFDGTPVVIVAGQRDIFAPSIITPDETYELIEITRPFTKWSWQVTRTECINEALVRAFNIAQRTPAGPVFLGIPQRVLDNRIEWKKSNIRQFNDYEKINCDPVMIERAARLLIRAKNPVIVAGSEVNKSEAISELKVLSELIAARVVSEPYITFSSFPSSSIYYFGNHLVNPKPVEMADVLLGAGCKLFLDKGHTYVPPVQKNTRIIHIHENPWEIGRVYPADVGMICNVKYGLREIIRVIREMLTEKNKSLINKRLKTIQSEKERICSKFSIKIKNSYKERESINPYRLFDEIKRELGHKAIIVDEAVTMSNHLLSVLNFDKPDSFFSRSGIYLGWGLPGAIGIKLAFPEKEVVACIGDGSFMFGLQALWTASRYKIPVKVIILNNRGYRAIRDHLQRRSNKLDKPDLYTGCDIINPELNFTRIVEGFDIYGKQISTPEEIEPALQELIRLKKPAVLDVIINQD